ncbi:hypothetical protein T11_4725 [Trichinella zimbabwensis]|uniref:Uncharacterized protein n=1 Tax=Trichinella zimbabwensis TaxID=268475 RepID=A0A0V1HVP6_9BILA|nr:hypothetical protein T11_4725 [Trichinella zimbabwensis]
MLKTTTCRQEKAVNLSLLAVWWQNMSCDAAMNSLDRKLPSSRPSFTAAQCEYELFHFAYKSFHIYPLLQQNTEMCKEGSSAVDFVLSIVNFI